MIVSMTEEDRQRKILSILDRSWKLWQSLASLIDQGLKNRKEVRKNPDNWDRICSSSDVINDTIRAIESYVKSDYPNEDVGLQYLFIYGLLQALYLQQDAVEDLFKTLRKCYPRQSQKFLYKRSNDLEEVRQLRNETTGHPTGTLNGVFTYINRGFLSKWHFENLRSSKATGNEFPSVDLFSMLKKQALAIENDLRILVEKIKEIEKMCYEKYKDRIAIITKGDIEYGIQTVAEDIFSPSEANQFRALSSLKTIESSYSEFEAGMKERGTNDFPELDEFKRAVSVLKEYISGERTMMTEEDAGIYYFYLTERHEYFKEMVEEIDSQYKTD